MKRGDLIWRYDYSDHVRYGIFHHVGPAGPSSPTKVTWAWWGNSITEAMRARERDPEGKPRAERGFLTHCGEEKAHLLNNCKLVSILLGA